MGDTIKTLLYEELHDDRETDKAWCITFSSEYRRVYLPKSRTEDIRETAREVDLPLWLIEAKGLEDFVKPQIR